MYSVSIRCPGKFKRKRLKLVDGRLVEEEYEILCDHSVGVEMWDMDMLTREEFKLARDMGDCFFPDHVKPEHFEGNKPKGISLQHEAEYRLTGIDKYDGRPYLSEVYAAFRKRQDAILEKLNPAAFAAVLRLREKHAHPLS